ncbi:hypothetical protein BT93_L0609 [Corymbia citriodora subsp. variegata]|uniref:Uncharacterized protein n=1 Tax=Corymbia citriodora subsp. variegata TaxID=360336 RepID=A0A8T0CUC5_CORYI|nr:hypothetical protein BT93_L0609 [Corymbia citriodora subsp. variegata]
MTQTSLGLVSSSSHRGQIKRRSNEHHTTFLAGDLDPEPLEELAVASLDPVPFLALVLLLDAPLSTDLKNSSLFHLHLHLLLLEAWQVGYEHVGFQRLLPVDLQVCEGGRPIVGPEVGSPDVQ